MAFPRTRIKSKRRGVVYMDGEFGSGWNGRIVTRSWRGRSHKERGERWFPTMLRIPPRPQYSCRPLSHARPRLNLSNSLNSNFANSSEIAFQLPSRRRPRRSPTRSLGGYLAEAHQKRLPQITMSIINDRRARAQLSQSTELACLQ